MAFAQDRVRIAVYHTGLGRDGPGLLLRDIRRTADDVQTVRAAIVGVAPDILLLLDIDWDMNNTALSALTTLLAEAGHPMPFILAPRPNTGMQTGLDMDGDRRHGTPDDAQGWARFPGGGSMALVSRLPIIEDGLIDHTQILWRDIPGARLPQRNGTAFPNDAVFDIQRLASVGAWEVPVLIRGIPLTIMAFHAGPPVFGGAEGRNRNRNADETAFWRLRLNGQLGPPPRPPFVLLGNANLDPQAGAGIREDITALLAHPALQDPRPQGQPPTEGAPGTVTAYWPNGPGALRVDYSLPSAGLRVLESGLVWPSPEAVHALVWLDIAWPP